jgi:hypothetical protein
VYASVAYRGFTVSDNWAVRLLAGAGGVVLEVVRFGGGFALLAAAGAAVAALAPVGRRHGAGSGGLRD